MWHYELFGTRFGSSLAMWQWSVSVFNYSVSVDTSIKSLHHRISRYFLCGLVSGHLLLLHRFPFSGTCVLTLFIACFIIEKKGLLFFLVKSVYSGFWFYVFVSGLNSIVGLIQTPQKYIIMFNFCQTGLFIFPQTETMYLHHQISPTLLFT